MTDRKDDWVQFGTLIPRGLHRQAKLYCVRRDVTLADFVSVALREKLDTSPRRMTSSGRRTAARA